MPGTGCVRVLVVDNEQDEVRGLLRALHDLGYQVESPSGAGDGLVQTVKSLAPRFRPHVVVLDLCLIPGSSADYMGLGLYESLKPARIIPYSSYLTPEATAKLHQMDIETWVSKGAAPQSLLDAVHKAAAKTAACRRGLEIERSAAWDPASFVMTVTRDPNVPADMAADVLCQVFPTVSRLTIEPLSATSISSQAPVHGHTVVRTVTADHRAHVVIKLARSERIRQEWDNYNRYVRDHLAGRYYPLAESHAEFWDLGCITYSLLSLEHGRFDTFANWYGQDDSVAQTAAPLTHLFRDLWGDHYRGKSSECRNLFEAYDRILALTRHLPGPEGRAIPPAVRALGAELPDPLAWASRNRDKSNVRGAPEVITHGDLHADNFFVDEQHAWPIDFERTGPGPRLRDLAELEVDIVTRLLPPHAAGASPEQDLPWFLPLARAVAGAPAPTDGLPAYEAVTRDPQLNKARGVVNEIRKLAFEMTQYEHMREYLWNLLLDAAWVTCHADPSSLRYHRAFLLGAILCQRLAGQKPSPAKVRNDRAPDRRRVLPDNNRNDDSFDDPAGTNGRRAEAEGAPYDQH